MSSIEANGLKSFYTNKTILITGSTGFLGLVLVEKLLRTFPQINELLLIIRAKKTKSSKERIADYFNNEIFERLKKERPIVLSKVVGLEGDITLEKCGLKIDEINYIMQKVDIVIHGAATVRFTENLKSAINTNIRGTLNVLRLAEGIENLHSFLYVSSAYSNCTNLILEEKLYPHPLSAEKLLKIAEIFNETMLDKLSPVMIEPWPNTYTYTKNACENLVYTYRNIMPIVIFRPSIITATLAEPIPSWVNKFVGPYGYMTTTGLGINRVVYCSKPDLNSNIVPCDLVANAILAAIWDISIKKQSSIKIINYSSEKNPVGWYLFSKKMMLGYTNNPFLKASWYPVCLVLKNRKLYEFLNYMLHIVPAFVTDVFLGIFNKKPFYRRFMNKTQKNLDEVSHFLNNDFFIVCDNIYEIWNRLSEKDKKLVNFDIKQVDWDEYLSDAMRGIKKYLLKEDMSKDGINRAKIKMFWLFILHQLVKTGFLAVFIYLLKHIFRYIS